MAQALKQKGKGVEPVLCDNFEIFIFSIKVSQLYFYIHFIYLIMLACKDVHFLMCT
jgi:hypothetical protein